ncbi:MAG: DNA alkylation repair protein [Thermoplasmata archaeon]|nr:DNA alkylation repair protein [Thermoplasmata archaeon]
MHASADARRAGPMQQYMRSALPYHGVNAPGLEAICRHRFAELAFSNAASWQRTTLFLWRHARFREERYAAIALSGIRAARAYQTPAVLPMYEEIIVTGAWWDYVDSVAIHRVGPILRSDRTRMARTMRSWSRSEDMWKRRTSIICQVGSGVATDQALLYDCIEPSIESREFFLRKAIGWALRQHARLHPDEVARYVARNEKRLSGLSRREATRHLKHPPAAATRSSR